MLRNKLFRELLNCQGQQCSGRSPVGASTKAPHRESASVYLSAVATVKVYNEKEIQSKHLI